MPFADQLMYVRLLADHHRHAAALEVERDFVHLLPATGERAGGLLVHPFQHRRRAGFSARSDSGCSATRCTAPVRWSFRRYRVVLQHDFVLRQGAGFIGAKNVHRAKVLDGVEVFNNHLCV